MIGINEADKLTAKIQSHLRYHGRAVRTVVVGSVRRRVQKVGDLDLLVVAPDGSDLRLDELTLEPSGNIEIARSKSSGERRRIVMIRYVSGQVTRVIQMDMYLAYKSELPYALMHHTGPRSYNIRIRAHAKKNGHLLNQYGLFNVSNGHAVYGSRGITTERELAALLGVTYRKAVDR